MSKKWDFLKEVTDIDDRFIEEAAGEWIQPIRNVQQILLKIAACFAIIVSLLLSGVSFKMCIRDRKNINVKDVPITYYKGTPLDKAINHLYIAVDQAHKNLSLIHI